MQWACVVLSSVSCIVLQCFSTLSHNRHDYPKRLLNRLCVFWFFLQLLSEIFLILRKTELDMIINVCRSWDDVEKYCRTGRATDEHTLRICNVYCLYTATMVVRTHFIDMQCALCVSYLCVSLVKGVLIWTKSSRCVLILYIHFIIYIYIYIYISVNTTIQ